MINDLFGPLAQIFPGVIFVVIVGALVLLGRTWARVSSGSVGAGPARVATPRQLGLQKLPWELQGIPDALARDDGRPLALLMGRADALGVPVDVLPSGSASQQVEVVLAQLEAALDLPPLVPPVPAAPTDPPTQVAP